MLLISFNIELHSFIFHILNLIIVSWLGLVSWMVGWLLVPLFLVREIGRPDRRGVLGAGYKGGGC